MVPDLLLRSPRLPVETRKKKEQKLFKDGKQKRNMIECVQFNFRTGFFLKNTWDNLCQDADDEFEQNVQSDFLFFQNSYVFNWARQII